MKRSSRKLITTPLFQQLQHGRRKLRRVEERSELNEFASDFGSASAASLLLNLEAVATAAIAWTVFRENVDKRVGAGFAFILLGVCLPLSRGPSESFHRQRPRRTKQSRP